MPPAQHHQASEAVILAAGFGSRLRDRSASKPLASIRGVPLIEIAVRQLINAGVNHVVVVTGHEAEHVENALEDIGKRLGVAITPVRLASWENPNGWSAIAGAAAVRDTFLLVMADHIFGDGLLAKLASAKLESCDVVLATDQIDNPLVDPDDATWVCTAPKGRIRAIGKDIDEFDAVDCGAFLATRELSSAIEEAIAQGRPGSLSDGMQVLADRGRAKTMDIGKAWWIDVDDPRSHDLAQQLAPQHISWLETHSESANA